MDNCVHKFKLIETVYSVVPAGMKNKYIRLDRFYCKKCLLIQNIVSASQSDGTVPPEWWPVKTEKWGRH